MSKTLPPLPETPETFRIVAKHGQEPFQQDLYTAEQMQAYALAALEQQRQIKAQGVPDVRRDALMDVIRRLNGHPYNLTKNECVDEVEKMLASDPPAPQAAVVQQEPVAWLHACRKKPSLRAVSLTQIEPTLAAKGYVARPLVYGDTHPAPQAKQPLTDAARDVLAERQRQVDVEGWTPAHDDKHRDCELAAAAATYATCDAKNHLNLKCIGAQVWPGRWSFNDQGYRRNLVKSGALILAEIERMDRAEAANGIKGE